MDSDHAMETPSVLVPRPTSHNPLIGRAAKRRGMYRNRDGGSVHGTDDELLLSEADDFEQDFDDPEESDAKDEVKVCVIFLFTRFSFFVFKVHKLPRLKLCNILGRKQ